MKARKRLWLPFLFAVLVCSSPSGCAASVGANGSDRDAPTPEKTEANPAAPGDTGLPEPPGSTLSYGGKTVKAGLGSYCWTSGSGGACADSIGTPVSGKTLTVSAGSIPTFVYEGGKLDSLRVSAERIGQGTHLERAGESGVLLPDERGDGYEKPTNLQVNRSGNRAGLIAELPAGEYAVSAFARMPQGDAHYGFRVLIKSSAHLPKTGGSELPDGPR